VQGKLQHNGNKAKYKASNNNTANPTRHNSSNTSPCFQRKPLALLRGPLYYSVR
jgi:hypothetical protein